MRLRRSAVFPLILLPFFMACAAGRESAEERRPLRPALSSIQVHVFDRSCVRSGCHLGTDVESRLSLRAGDSRGGLVGTPSSEIRDLMRVKPGDPDGSYLIRKLEGVRIVGERMPLGSAPLPPETIAVIREWIARGAPDS